MVNLLLGTLSLTSWWVKECGVMCPLPLPSEARMSPPRNDWRIVINSRPLSDVKNPGHLLTLIVSEKNQRALRSKKLNHDRKFLRRPRMSGRRMSGTFRRSLQDISWTAIFPRKRKRRRQEPELPGLAWTSQTSCSQTSAATRISIVAWNVQSRSNISIPRCFYLRGPPGATEKGSIENFNPRSIARNFKSRRPQSIFSIFGEKLKYHPFWRSSLFYKAPPRQFRPPKCKIDALQNVNWQGVICVFLYKNCSLEVANLHFGGRRFTFWRAPIYILEAEIVLGVLYRKGVIPKKGGTLGSREDSLGPLGRSPCSCWRWLGRYKGAVAEMGADVDQADINSVQTRCIVKGEAQKSPLFWRFSGGFWFSQDRLVSRNSTRKPLNLIESPIFTNAPCKTACLYNAPSMHTLEDIYGGSGKKVFAFELQWIPSPHC